MGSKLNEGNGLILSKQALGPEEINHKSQNFVVSNFIYERGMDIKQAFVKQCTDVPELSVDLKVEDIGFIRKIDDKGKGHKYQVHFHSIQKRNELFSKRFLLGKHRKIFLDLDLTFLQRQKNREVISKLDEVNKCRCENGKLPIKGFRCGKHLKLNKLDFDINQNFEEFIKNFD